WWPTLVPVRPRKGQVIGWSFRQFQLAPSDHILEDELLLVESLVKTSQRGVITANFFEDQVGDVSVLNHVWITIQHHPPFGKGIVVSLDGGSTFAVLAERLPRLIERVLGGQTLGAGRRLAASPPERVIDDVPLSFNRTGERL